jgi:hypothetical protein
LWIVGFSVTAKDSGGAAIGPLASTLGAGFGFVSIPFWIYRRFSLFLFEHTWADVSCFFTEGYGMVFLIVEAPLLTAATLLRELFVLRAQRRNAVAW